MTLNLKVYGGPTETKFNNRFKSKKNIIMYNNCDGAQFFTSSVAEAHTWHQLQNKCVVTIYMSSVTYTQDEANSLKSDSLLIFCPIYNNIATFLIHCNCNWVWWKINITGLKLIQQMA